jgi:glyoxylase-like metal-dependent hydrolase (beta-lactamase superfamily II)
MLSRRLFLSFRARQYGGTTDVPKTTRRYPERAMTKTLPEYELFAIRYATRAARSTENFIGHDIHDEPMPLDYFVWVAKGPTETILIDLGFTAEVAVERKRDYLRCPIDALGLLGVHAADIKTVIVTHLHYDHVGNFHKLPNAEFYLQEPEIHFATGRHMRYKFLRAGYNLDDIVGIVRLNFVERIRFQNGPAEVTPGITIHPVGGHSVGLQFVRVHTRRGWVIVASDTTHFFANMHRGQPFPAIISTPDMMEAWDKLRAAAPTPNHIIPGHDPLVMQIYPSPSKDLEGIVVRLDVEPAGCEP